MAAVFILAGVVEAATPTSMIVDYGATTTDLALGSGESGVLTLTVKNTGGQSAENVKVELYGEGSISVSKEFYLGTVSAGESKSVAGIVRIISQPVAGISAVKVTVYYDGYDSTGAKKYGQTTVWEVPVKITGNPQFRIMLSKNSYYEGALNNLTFGCTPTDPLTNVEATLSSDCLTVIGPSKQYIGEMYAGESNDISYLIRPTSIGACQTTLDLAYNDKGVKSSEGIPIGLNIDSSPVDFKILGVDYGTIGPGDTATVNITIKNDGSLTAKDATAYLTLTDPFSAVGSVESVIGDVTPSETKTVPLRLYVNWNAVTQTYTVPLNIDYKVGEVSSSQETSFGLDVTGQVTLVVLSVS